MSEEESKVHFEKPVPLDEPIDAEPILDNTGNFSFPFRLSDLPRMLSTDPQADGDLLTTTITENRAGSFPPAAFRRNDGLVFFDLTLKGGGGTMLEKPNVELFTNTAKNIHKEVAYNPKAPVPAILETDEGSLVVRYATKPFTVLTSHYGVHDSGNGLRDHYTSRYLEEKGLRTRSFIATWELPPETEMVTPEGVITAEEFFKETGVKPGLELVASRCKYRVQDILRYIFEIENADSSEKLHPVRVSTTHLEKTVPFDQFDAGRYSPETLDDIQETFIFLGNEITKRAIYDQDTRFVELGKKFPSIGDQNFHNFFSEYLQTFAQVLGEQFAMLQNSAALSGMFNLQNLTLLSEIVDHDVTIIDGKRIGDDGEFESLPDEKINLYRKNLDERDLNFLNQLFQGYDGLRVLVRDLSRAGIIRIDSEGKRAILQGFLSSFKGIVQEVTPQMIEVALEKKEEYAKKHDSKEPFGPKGQSVFFEDFLELFYYNETTI